MHGAPEKPSDLEAERVKRMSNGVETEELKARIAALEAKRFPTVTATTSGDVLLGFGDVTLLVGRGEVKALLPEGTKLFRVNPETVEAMTEVKPPARNTGIDGTFADFRELRRERDEARAKLAAWESVFEKHIAIESDLVDLDPSVDVRAKWPAVMADRWVKGLDAAFAPRVRPEPAPKLTESELVAHYADAATALINKYGSTHTRVRHVSGKEYTLLSAILNEGDAQHAVMYTDGTVLWTQPLARFLERFEAVPTEKPAPAYVPLTAFGRRAVEFIKSTMTLKCSEHPVDKLEREFIEVEREAYQRGLDRRDVEVKAAPRKLTEVERKDLVRWARSPEEHASLIERVEGLLGAGGELAVSREMFECAISERETALLTALQECCFDLLGKRDPDQVPPDATLGELQEIFRASLERLKCLHSDSVHAVQEELKAAEGRSLLRLGWCDEWQRWGIELSGCSGNSGDIRAAIAKMVTRGVHLDHWKNRAAKSEQERDLKAGELERIKRELTETQSCNESNTTRLVEAATILHEALGLVGTHDVVEVARNAAYRLDALRRRPQAPQLRELSEIESLRALVDAVTPGAPEGNGVVKLGVHPINHQQFARSIIAAAQTPSEVQS